MKTERTPRQLSGIPAGHQPKPIAVVDQVSVAVHWDSWLTLRALAAYSSLSPRTLQAHLHDFRDPIPSYRVGSKVLIKRSEFDAWLARRRNTKAQALAHLAAADAQALLSSRPQKIP